MYKEAVEVLRKSVSIEDATERQDAVGRAIKDIDRVVADYKSDIESVNTESKTRKLKIRDLEGKLEKVNDENERLKSDNSLGDITEERDALKTFKESALGRYREDFISAHKSLKDHKDYDKIKGKLTIPDSDNGEVDWKKLSNEEVEKNQEVITVAKGYGLFSQTGKPDTTHHGDAEVKSIGVGLFDKMGKK